MGSAYNYLHQLRKFDKRIRIYYDSGKDLISAVRETKDKEEVKRIKKVRNGVVAAFAHLLKTVSQYDVQQLLISKIKDVK